MVIVLTKSKHDNIEIDDLLDEGEVKKNPPISTLKPNDYINNIDNENKAKEIKDDDIDEVLDINDEMFIAHKEKEKKQEEIKNEPIIQKEPSVHNEPPVYNNAEDEEPIEELDIDNHIEENKVEDKKVGEHQIEEKTHRNIVNEVKEDNTLKNNKDKKDDEEEDYNFDNLLSDHEGKEKEDDDDIFMTRQKAPIKSELPKKEIEELPKKVEPLIVKPKPQPIKKKAELDDAKPIIRIFNKTDLIAPIDALELAHQYDGIAISAKFQSSTLPLIDRIQEFYLAQHRTAAEPQIQIRTFDD